MALAEETLSRWLRSSLVTDYPLLADFVLEGGRQWIEAAEPWQVEDLAAILNTSGPLYHWLSRPRGGDKTGSGTMAAMLVLHYQASPMSEAPIVAADKDGAARLTRRMRAFVDRAPAGSELREWDAKLTVATAPNGSRVMTMSADAASAWGDTPAIILCDELMQWPRTAAAREVWDAVWSSMVKYATARLVVMTTRGQKGHWAGPLLTKVEEWPEHWRLSKVTGPVPWHSEHKLEVQKAFLLDASYNRLHLNEDDEASTDDGSWITHHVRRPGEGESPMRMQW